MYGILRTIPKYRRSLLAASALAVPLAPPLMLPLYAGQYDALCGGIKCIVVVSPAEISSPYGRIPSKRVTHWSSSGDSKTSIGTSGATTVLLGGIGLLGFLAQNHQYNFTVTGFDASGSPVSMQFEFKNDRPARLLTQEMMAVTGLGMGQSRTAEDIMAAESSTQTSPGVMPTQSPGRLAPMGQPSRLLTTSATGKNCWSTYLQNNPAMKKWSESNPTQAEQNKKRFDDC